MTNFTQALPIFLGTLPLLAAIVLNLLSNNSRFGRIEAQLDRIETRLNSMETRLDSLAERVSKIEGKIEGGRVIVER